MLFAVFFTDDPAHADARARLMPEHLAFLQRNAHRISSAGPLRDVRSDLGTAGLWLVQADSAAEIIALYESDPLWPTGLRASVTVYEWTQVFTDRAARLAAGQK